MAVVLPGTFLHAEYSLKLLKQIIPLMKFVTIVLIKQRLFQETSEESVLFLAEGYQSDNTCFRIINASSFDKLSNNFSKTTKQGKKVGQNYIEEGLLLNILPQKTLRLFKKLQQKSVQLGDFAEIRIGVVTGANRFFILSEKERKQWGISPHFFIPIVSTSKLLKGLQFKSGDFNKLDYTNRTLLLVVNDIKELPSKLLDYLNEGARTLITERFHCKKRKTWYNIEDVQRPDAYLTYMSHILPKIVLNKSKATCTNSIHRMRFVGNKTKHEKETIALSMLSSFSQLSLELVGRSYGGGILKLEPGEATRISLLIPNDSKQLSSLFKEVDQNLRKGNTSEAINCVDESLLQAYFKLQDKDIHRLRRGWAQLANRRTQRNLPFFSQLIC